MWMGSNPMDAAKKDPERRALEHRPRTRDILDVWDPPRPEPVRAEMPLRAPTPGKAVGE